MCRRDWTTRNRLATYAPSVSAAFAARLAPVAWKSEKAADWWLRAGQLASARSANKEAIGHLTKSLVMIEKLSF